MMTVGEAARAIGVSPKAIRVWESRGLIPQAERTASGYRTFTETDLATLRFIRQAKALGLTLGEIRDVLQLREAGASPCGRVVQAIDAHLFEIDRSIADLMQLRDTLTATRTAAETACPDVSGAGVCHLIERNEDRRH